jgi:hypothetical protein
MSVTQGYWPHTDNEGERMAESEKTRAQRWMDLLGEDGFRPRLEVNGEEPERSCIAFRAEGLTYHLYLHEGDRTFFNFTLCYRLGTYAMAPDFAVLAAANEENFEAKVAKLTVNLQDRSVTVAIEGFCDVLPTTKVLERMVDQCRHSADRFFNRLKDTGRPVPLAS